MNSPSAATAWLRLLPLLTVAAIAWFPLARAHSAEEPGVKVGDSFPKLAEFGLEGDLPKDPKARLVIVDFWASWCGPCRGTFPMMEELHKRLGKRGLVIVAVNEDKSRVAMNEFLRLHPVTFTVVRDPQKKLAATVNVATMPASYILDGDGKVVAIQSGERTMQNRAAYMKLVESLLDQQPPRKP